MKDDLQFLRLWDLYSPLLTAIQREITDLYFNYDLSLGEIAEQKGVSRQSVYDCLQKCRRQLEGYEQRLGFSKLLQRQSLEYSAYSTTVERWIAEMREGNKIQAALDGLEGALAAVQKEFDSQPVEE